MMIFKKKKINYENYLFRNMILGPISKKKVMVEIMIIMKTIRWTTWWCDNDHHENNVSMSGIPSGVNESKMQLLWMRMRWRTQEISLMLLRTELEKRILVSITMMTNMLLEELHLRGMGLKKKVGSWSIVLWSISFWGSYARVFDPRRLKAK